MVEKNMGVSLGHLDPQFLIGKYRSFIFGFFPILFFNFEINGKKERKSTGKNLLFCQIWFILYTYIFRSLLRMKINACRKHEKWVERSGG
jgi:hypothetical protein